ncbi:MAG: sulfotransferase [Flavobacteriales bacterium]
MNEIDRIHLVTIQSVPRSGSSWLGQIFKSSPRVEFRFQPLFSYAFKGAVRENTGREEILKFFSEILSTTDHFILQRDAYHVEYPDLAERNAVTHLVMKEVRYNHVVRNMLHQLPELRLIGLVRHPCAVLDSWFNAPREFSKKWSIDEEWRSGALKNQRRPEEYFGFDKWKEVASLFMALKKEFPGQVHIVQYCDLNDDTEVTVKSLFNFCGLEYGSETATFIEESKSKQGSDANSIYRLARRDDSWKSRLPDRIAREVESELSGTPLEQFLR